MNCLLLLTHSGQFQRDLEKVARDSKALKFASLNFKESRPGSHFGSHCWTPSSSITHRLHHAASCSLHDSLPTLKTLGLKPFRLKTYRLKVKLQIIAEVRIQNSNELLAMVSLETLQWKETREPSTECFGAVPKLYREMQPVEQPLHTASCTGGLREPLTAASPR